MAHIDQSKPKEIKWKNITSKCSDTIQRAAALQARELGIGNPAQEAGRLSQEYGVFQKGKDWREYGDVAFHLSAVYPPDLAIFVLYAFRHIVPKTRHDPVPYILKAVEKIFLLGPENIRLNIEMNDEVKRLLRNSDERARKGAKILAREISFAPLRHASGIYDTMDQKMKSFVEKEMQNFNPSGAKILARGSRAWLLTPTGLLRGLLRLLFGKV